MTKQKFFKWVVVFSIDERWVADGFDLTDDRALEMLENYLPFAYEHEMRVRVIDAPKAADILRAQER